MPLGETLQLIMQKGRVTLKMSSQPFFPHEASQALSEECCHLEELDVFRRNSCHRMFRALLRYTLRLPGPAVLAKSLLIRSSRQHDALSAASPILRTAAFLSLPVIPTADSIFHTDCAGKPLHPTSTVRTPYEQPSLPTIVPTLLQQVLYFALFLSWASSQPSSQGTVNSIMTIFFPSSDDTTASGRRSKDFLRRTGQLGLRQDFYVLREFYTTDV
ncbi:hypothetical protein Bbelb_428190 [Branchiostoma belcheri]|nr:hypothetical protein Bbelb_428190 [Branchiostoma belcheri]